MLIKTRISALTFINKHETCKTYQNEIRENHRLEFSYVMFTLYYIIKVKNLKGIITFFVCVLTAGWKEVKKPDIGNVICTCKFSPITTF